MLVVTVQLRIAEVDFDAQSLREEVARVYDVPVSAVQLEIVGSALRRMLSNDVQVRVQIAFDDVQRGLEVHFELTTRPQNAGLTGVVVGTSYAQASRDPPAPPADDAPLEERVLVGIASSLGGSFVSLLLLRVLRKRK